MSTSKNFSFGRRISILSTLCLLSIGAMAQSLSQKPITIVVPYGAGSGADAVARMIGDPLSKKLGVPVLIDNKPGALGQIAVSQVRKSTPDGHTLLLGDPGVILFYPLAKKPAPFDPLTDFVHVSLMADSGLTWLVPAQRGYKTVKDYVAVQKTKDKAMLLTVALAAHVATAQFADKGGFKYEPVTIRNASDVIPLIASGEAEGVFVSNAFAVAQIAGGRVAGLMQTGESRSKLLPEIPTAAEAGFPGVNAPTWFSLSAPAGTPNGVVQELSRNVIAVLRDPALKQKLEAMGVNTVASTPEEMRVRFTKELNEWRPIVEKSNVTVP